MTGRPKTQKRSAVPTPAGRSAPAAPAAPWTARITAEHVALGLAALHLVVLLLSFLPIPHDGGDNAAYLGLATSLRENGTYRELWDPAHRPHTQYPPGWPMILAAAMTVGIEPWVGFKVLVAFFSAAGVAFAYLWARRAATPGVALGAGVLLAVGPGVVELGRWELSDVPFHVFCMLALWAFTRLPGGAADPAAAPPPEPAEGAPRWKAAAPMLLAAGATLLAYMTRSAGLPLVVAVVVWLAWRRRWTGLALFAAVVGPFAVAWWARGRLAGGPSYAGYLWYVDPYRPMLGRIELAGLLERLVRNTVIYTTEFVPYLLTGVRFGKPAAALGIAVVLLALVGWGMRMRRPGVAELWLPLYIGLVLIWPAEWASHRFLLPALPVMLVCAWEPLRRLAPRQGQRTVVGAVIVALIVMAAIPPMAGQIQRASRCRAAYGPASPRPCMPEPWDDFLGLAQSVKGSLPAGSAVLSRKSTLFWAYSGYPSRTYPFTADPDTLLLAAREAGARYVMLDYMDQVSVMYLAPVLMQRPQAFCVMRALGPGRATLMAILPGAERMPNLRDRPGDETADVAFPRCAARLWAPGKALPEDLEATPPPGAGAGSGAAPGSTSSTPPPPHAGSDSGTAPGSASGAPPTTG